MLKYLFFFTFIIAPLSVSLQAQALETPNPDSMPRTPKKSKLAKTTIYRYEVQADVSRFFNETFKLFGLARNTTDFESLPANIGFKYFDNKGKIAARAGVGFYYRHREGGSEAFRDRVTTDSSSQMLRLGVERRFESGTHFSWGIGFDGLLGRYRWKSVKDSGFDELTETKSTGFIGGAPILTFQWHISPQIRLGAEMAYAIRFNQERQTQSFRDNPQFNTAALSFRTAEARWYGPGNVYLSILF